MSETLEITPVVTPTAKPKGKRAAPKAAAKSAVTKQYPPKGAAPASPKAVGRPKAEAKDPKVVEKEVKALLADLKATTDSEENKRLRRKLRARGHYGGLGVTTPAAPAKK